VVELYSITAAVSLLITNSFLSLQLIFSIATYEAVIDAYLDGLEASGLSDLSRVTSVASFFVSRVDTLIDKMLEKIGTPEALALRGKVNKTRISFFLMLELKLFTELCNMNILCSARLPSHRPN
jgi:transaldolase